MKFKKGDKVKVLSGRDNGREGTIERVYEKSDTVVIPDINKYKKHMKKSEQMPQGGIVEVPRPIKVSKLVLMCPKCGKASRIGYQIEKGKKSRICKKCKSVI